MVDLDIGLPSANGAVEIPKRAAPLLDDLDKEHFVVLDLPGEGVLLVDIELLPDPSRNGCLILGGRALGVDAFTTQIREMVVGTLER